MNPDELLAQIRQMLDEYLAMGAGTPVEAEAQALAAAIDSTAGGGGAPPDAGGGMPPDPSGMPPEGMPPGGEVPQGAMMSGDVPMPDMTGGMPLDQQQGGGNYGSMKEANAALQDDILKRIKGR